MTLIRGPRFGLRAMHGGWPNCAWDALPGTFQVAEIDVGGILQAYPVILIVLGENSLQFFHHGREIRMVSGGDERTAAQASGDAFEIKFLKIREGSPGVSVWAKEIAHVLLAWVAFLHAGVVRAEFSKQGFVVAEKGSCVREPLVPNDHHPACGFKDANEFGAGGVLVEPVEGLAGGDKIHACVIERGGFGGAIDAGETVVGG